MKKEKTYGIDRPNEPNSAHELIRTKYFFTTKPANLYIAKNKFELGLSGDDTLERARRDLTWFSKMSAGQLLTDGPGTAGCGRFLRSRTAVSIPDRDVQIRDLW